MNNINEKIIAHRGESLEAPENSLSAINMAWKNGVKIVEIDIRLSADHEIVVIHNKHTSHVGNKRLSIEKSLLKELKSVDIGIKKSKTFEGERIPTLIEVLNTVPMDGKLLIEIKCDQEIIKPLIPLLNETSLRDDQVEIIAFDIDMLTLIKKEGPQYKALWLLNLDYYVPQGLLLIKPHTIIKKLKQNGLDGVYAWAGKMIDRSFVDAFKLEGYLFYVWTVNEVYEAQKLLDYGIDGLTTDRAQWMQQQLLRPKQ